MKYLLVMEQDGGCDYTIGCGLKVEPIEASNMQEATAKAFEYLSEDREGKLREDVDRATLYQIPAESVLDLSGYRNKYKKEQEAQAKVSRENAERAEFERLKSKFGAGV